MIISNFIELLIEVFNDVIPLFLTAQTYGCLFVLFLSLIFLISIIYRASSIYGRVYNTFRWFLVRFPNVSHGCYGSWEILCCVSTSRRIVFWSEIMVLLSPPSGELSSEKPFRLLFCRFSQWFFVSFHFSQDVR